MLNLIQPKYKLAKYRNIAVRYAVLSLLIVVICALSINIYKANIVSRLEDYKSLNTNLRTNNNLLEQSKNNIKNIEEEIKALERLKNNPQTHSREQIRSFDIYTIMYDLANVAPADLQFYNIDASNNTVIIKGIAQEPQSIGAFLINLKTKDWIGEVDISSTQELVRENGYSYYSFEIFITLRRGV